MVKGNTKEVWVYDLRANMPNFGKRTLLDKARFKEFIACFGDDPHGKAKRKDLRGEGRFRCFTREWIRDVKDDNLDISWLRYEGGVDKIFKPGNTFKYQVIPGGDPMPTQVKPMAIKLPQQDRERLQKLGEAKKRSAHWLAKEAISQFLDREEAAEQFRRETVARWEEYCHTGKSVPHDAVMKWLESWGTENEIEAPKCE